MIKYQREPDRWIETASGRIASYFSEEGSNIDPKTVDSFGEEWTRFDHFDEADIQRCGDEYFDLLQGKLKGTEEVLDLGCGTGRWSGYLASRVHFIEAIDPSKAVVAAEQYLASKLNIRITQASVDSLPFADESFDLIVSLGVLHHIPDTAAAIATATKKLKKGGRFLLYLYYRFDNRSGLFKSLFYASNVVRMIISRMPKGVKQVMSDLIALFIYLPFVTFARILNAVGLTTAAKRIPLSYYTDKSFYIMRNDALDRFGTPLEQRFTKHEIEDMLVNAGLNNIQFSEQQPYWHVVAYK